LFSSFAYGLLLEARAFSYYNILIFCYASLFGASLEIEARFSGDVCSVEEGT
jgi:hypothetical protein